jgi:hypothetical protein
MSLKRDKVTEWAKRNGDAIDKHWAQPLPKTTGIMFGSGYFGLAYRTLQPLIPGEYSKYTYGLNPQAVYEDISDGNWDDIIDRAAVVGGSILGKILSGFIGYSDRAYLEKLSSKPQMFGEFNGYRYNHKIEEKGYLSFSYPNDAVRGVLASDHTITRGMDTYNCFKLPFFENPVITETRNAEYASHKILNRNEPYRLWTGASPAKLNVNFQITLPHLLTFARQLIKDAGPKILKSNKFKELLKEDLINMHADTPNFPNLLNDNYVTEKFDDILNYAEDRYEFTLKTLENIDLALQDGTNEVSRARLIVYCTYLIGLIRSSVIGSSNASEVTDIMFGSEGYREAYRNTMNANRNIDVANAGIAALNRSKVRQQQDLFGPDKEGTYHEILTNNQSLFSPPISEIDKLLDPEKSNFLESFYKKYLPAPITFLTYGALYNNSPFIVKSYSMTFDGKSGYEELSMLPRVIKIKLTLESFNQFPDSQLKRGVSEIFKGVDIN